MESLKCCYIWDENLIEQCDRLPAVLGRASLVHSLLVAYGLHKNVNVVKSSPASYDDLRKFHSDLYLDHLKRFAEVNEDYISTSQDEEYGIGYDCAPVSNMYDLVSAVAGGSITAAKCLLLGIADVAINWCGGWHHAQRFGAEGFCYVNDIVLAIETLKLKFSKILYIDLDIHHGNGVQDAYNLSKSVFTLSFHKYEPGFYPGTGSIDDVGSLTGQGYTCNFPLHASYSDDTLEYAFQEVFSAVYSQFGPESIVVQCGADALARDPNGGAALTARAYCTCIKMVLDKRKPTILLGGGGYNYTNAARLWSSITALVAGVKLDDNIPEHSNWTKYGPDYMLHVETTLARDINKPSYVETCINTIKDNLKKYLENTIDRSRLKRKTNKPDTEKLQGTKDLIPKYRIINESNTTSTTDTEKDDVTHEVLTKSNQVSQSKDVYDFVD
ncbi:histone deacetylase 8-like [Achroia grisella]|uniref:histone deacetylase 8-like n=1 Tax=Achroia grisella TaxID=688607 RepID=UPI0027D2D895|nr:histone deacetylase 8-like [Achroia grisella]